MKHLKQYENEISKEDVKKYTVMSYSNNIFLDEIKSIDDEIELKTISYYHSSDLIKNETTSIVLPINYLNYIEFTSDNLEEAKEYFYEKISLIKNSKKFGL